MFPTSPFPGQSINSVSNSIPAMRRICHVKIMGPSSYNWIQFRNQVVRIRIRRYFKNKFDTLNDIKYLFLVGVQSDISRSSMLRVKDTRFNTSFFLVFKRITQKIELNILISKPENFGFSFIKFQSSNFQKVFNRRKYITSY